MRQEIDRLRAELAEAEAEMQKMLVGKCCAACAELSSEQTRRAVAEAEAERLRPLAAKWARSQCDGSAEAALDRIADMLRADPNRCACPQIEQDIWGRSPRTHGCPAEPPPPC